MDNTKVTKGMWELYKGHDNQFADRPYIIEHVSGSRLADDVIAEMVIDTGKNKMEANANLIVTAVNMCKEINPDDPLSVAKEIKQAFEALRTLVDHFRYNDENYYKSDLCTDIIDILSRVEGKG